MGKPMEIKTKDEFYRLYHGMRLGNRLRTFDTYADLCSSGYRGYVSMRYKAAGADAFKAYYVPTYEVPIRMGQFAQQGADPDLFTFNESAPDDELVIQGELCHTIGGLHLSYSGAKVSMREALSQASQVSGLMAKSVLETYLRPASYDMVQELIDLYPDAAIEFGIYSRCIGVLLGHNTIIWEVRNY